MQSCSDKERKVWEGQQKLDKNQSESQKRDGCLLALEDFIAISQDAQN